LKARCTLVFLFLAAIQPLVAQDSAKEKPSHSKFLQNSIAPASLMAASLIIISQDHNENFFLNRFRIRDDRNNDFPNFKTSADNYLQYAPMVAAYVLSFSGVKGKHDLANQTALLVKTEILLTAFTEPLKYATHVQRPDGSNYHSFPSGHTTQAFAAAAFLDKEYRHISVWISIGGYTVASAVGAMRILNNKHWDSDVLMGAGIGILSTNLVYLTHQNRWGKKGTKTTLMPTYNRGAGVYFSYLF
jgi:hypothetical protein